VETSRWQDDGFVEDFSLMPRREIFTAVLRVEDSTLDSTGDDGATTG
jgi:hypothetical protein